MADGIDAKLEQIDAAYEQTAAEMASSAAASDPERMRRLGRRFAELDEVVRPYRAYRAAAAQADEARELAKDEADPEMAAFFEAEAERADERVATLRADLERLLIPRDPNEGKDV